MIYYAKISSKTSSDDIRDLFLKSGATNDTIALDTSSIQKREGSFFQLLKNQLLETGESLTIDSLQSLGKTSREISKELRWFLENDVHLIVLNLPSTKQSLSSPMQVLSEVYSILAASEIRNVKENQKIGIHAARISNKPLGRARIPYPENWESTYRRWKQKDISIAEFMELTGLKRGTLYNLIKQYNIQEQESSRTDSERCV